ncbi:hypothetical protein DV737_g209, partial [Chaetothyriales sp. CBS 132003]
MPPQDGAGDADSTSPVSQPHVEQPAQQLVLEEFSEVEDDPARFREGIAAYAPFVAGTHLPEAFLDLDERCENATSPTFLLLVVKCLPAWFKKAKAKKVDRHDPGARSFSKSDQDVTWLLELIRDYIKIEIHVVTSLEILLELFKRVDPLGASGDGGDEQMAVDMLTMLEGLASSSDSAAISVAATRALVGAFGQLFTSRPKAAVFAFQSLVNVAGTTCKFPAARIEAMRILCRLRSTASGMIYLDSDPDCRYVASMLCRTNESATLLQDSSKTQRHSARSSLWSSDTESADSEWMFDDEQAKVPITLEPCPNLVVDKKSLDLRDGTRFRLDIAAWLIQATACLQSDTEWETYSYILVHLSSQLANIKLFRNSLSAVATLRRVLHEQIVSETLKAPPTASGLTKSDVALCLFTILTPLIAYATIEDAEIDKTHWEKQLVQAFMAGMDDSKFDGTFRGCVHALSVCSLEMPGTVGREYPHILEKMSKVTTKSHLSVHMMEFLCQVAMLPEVHKHFNTEDKRKVFAICTAVLNDRRDELLKQQEQQEQPTGAASNQPAKSQTPSRYSGVRRNRPPYRAQMMQDVGVPLYASALVYQAMIGWFLSVRISEREELAREIMGRLVWHDKQNEPVFDQQAEVFRDMMLRTAYSDLGETRADPEFESAIAGGEDGARMEESQGRVSSMSWLVGYSIVTLQTAGHTGRTQMIKRQASGTTYAVYQQLTGPRPPHQASSGTMMDDGGPSIEMLPQHVILQLQTTAKPTSPSEQPIPLPEDDPIFSRAIRTFDRNPTIDSVKAGVLYVGPGQDQQDQILANQRGSASYDSFLSLLGTKVSLKSPCGLFNPQGLEYPTDGEWTVAWCDRTTEIVFLVPTMMPPDPEGEQQRFSHVGNAYVNIIFNESGKPWKLDTLKTAFSYVNIVITPVDRSDSGSDTMATAYDDADDYYQVQVLTRGDIPNISPAADPKIASARRLPRLVCIWAISACVFSQAWEHRDDKETHSPWRSRLIEIKKLRQYYTADSSQHEGQTRAAVASAMGAGRKAGPVGAGEEAFYAQSDEDEADYNTVTHARSGKGVKLLFSKSKVYVHPTPSAKNNIPGFIALVQQKSQAGTTDGRPTSSGSRKSPSAADYLLAWTPESALAQDDLSTYVKVDMSSAESPPKQQYLVPPLPLPTFEAVGPYAFSLPLSSIYSIIVRPPSLGWWYGSVVINTRAGSSVPPLFFHDSECESTILQKKKRARESFDPFGEHGHLFWGGDEVLSWLKRYVNVERSIAEPSVYLIDPSEEDRVGFGQGPKSWDGQRRSIAEGKQPAPKREGPGMDPLTKALKETRWKILEQLSKVTTFTRRTAEDLANNKSIPPQVRRLIQNPEVQTIQDEFDSARLYLARWALGIAEQSEREKNQRIWTAKDIIELEESSVGDFEILDTKAGRMSLAGDKRKPVNLEEWNSFFDSAGRLHNTVNEVKERIFHGGLDAEDGVRKAAWPFLLGVYDWRSSAEERKGFLNSKRDEYIRLKGAWWDRMIDGQTTAEQEEWWKEQKGRIEKDVHRTDRNIPLFAGEDIPHPDPSSPFYSADGPGTNVHMEQLKDMLLTYLEYDTPASDGDDTVSSQPQDPSTVPSSSSPRRYVTSNPNAQNLGYVQGMSDLLSPLYAVFQDDALAFWAFVSFMRRMSRNFVRSQSGMRSQLNTLDQLVQLLDPKLYLHLQSADSTNFFFFFRMLLVWYKREFEWSDVLRLWEVLWTDYLSSQFHLFIAMAILEKHRDVIMDHLKHFDEVLKYFNELSGTIDLRETLVRAEGLFKRFEHTVGVVEKKDTLPELRWRKNKAAIMNGPGGGPAKADDRGSATATGSAASARPSSQGRDAESKGANNDKVISPELRHLLDRKTFWVDEAIPAEKPGGARESGLRD